MSAAFDPARFSVVLVATRNSLNIGAVARAMCNFGFGDLRLVRPYEPSFREARSAVGATIVLKNAVEYAGVADAVADCTFVMGTTAIQRRQPQHPMHPLANAAVLVRSHLQSGVDTSRRAALLFGSEKSGLSNDDLSYCHALLHIPTAPEQPSMNLGQAAAVCFYELARREAAPTSDQPAASASGSELDRLEKVIQDVLASSEYMDRHSKTNREGELRRLLRRLQLSSTDSSIWLGMWRQILWKLNQRK